jgi:hypothetical protein
MNENINTVNATADKRKLATIARIEQIVPIEGADNIEHARIRGWRVVVKKGEFKPGDLCVYVEVDSVMPDGLSSEKVEEWRTLNKQMSKVSEEERQLLRKKMEEITKENTRPEFEFLRGVKFHIKTRRIFSYISQGICFPLSILNTGNWELVVGGLDIEEDIDVTDILGVTQYIAPDPAVMGGDAKGMLEAVGVLISDEERCLHEDVILETENGFKTIKEICKITYKGKVKSFNIETFEEEWQPIIKHNIIKNNKDWFKVTLENGKTIIATSIHRFYLPELNCYRQLKDLEIGQKLLIKDTKI